MWLLWRSDVVEVEVLFFTEQEIHARINGSHFKSIEEAQSWLLASPTHSEDAANNAHITQDKSQDDFSDFRGLMEEVVKSGTVTLPPSLALIDKKIEKKYGEIAGESKQSSFTAMPSRVLLCAEIKEKDELQLESID
ncbi:hypothetical protein QUC31_009131 [Theobroma cacao]